MTSQRFQILDFTHAVTFAELLIISREMSSSVTGTFVADDIFRLTAGIRIFIGFLKMSIIMWFSSVFNNDIIHEFDSKKN